MNDGVICGTGYIMMVSPAIYWIVIDFHRFKEHVIKLLRRRRKSSNKLSYDDEQPGDRESLISTLSVIRDREKSVSPSLHTEPMQNVLKTSCIMLWFGLMITSYLCIRFMVNYLDWKRRFKYLAS